MINKEIETDLIKTKKEINECSEPNFLDSLLH